jgi:F-type H+-transporting ATPase subunit b
MTESTTQPGIAALGIDVKAIIFQIINFALLLLILKWVAFKPILKILDERRKKISNSLKIAKELEEKQQAWRKKERQLLQQALSKSQEIMQASQKQARQDSEDMLAKTRSQQEQIIRKTQAQLKQEKTRLLKEVKSQVAELVAAATAKVLKKKVDSAQDQQLIKDSLRQIKKE